MSISLLSSTRAFSIGLCPATTLPIPPTPSQQKGPTHAPKKRTSLLDAVYVVGPLLRGSRARARAYTARQGDELRFKMQVERFRLFRQDIRDLVELTVGKMDLYHMVGHRDPRRAMGARVGTVLERHGERRQCGRLVGLFISDQCIIIGLMVWWSNQDLVDRHSRIFADLQSTRTLQLRRFVHPHDQHLLLGGLFRGATAHLSPGGLLPFAGPWVDGVW